jgi:glycosyltransferase involved in cell wall biosynthesis
MRIAINTQSITEFQERNTPVFGLSVIPLLSEVMPEASFVLLDENELFPEMKAEIAGYYTDTDADICLEVSTYDFWGETPRVVAVLDADNLLIPDDRWWHKVFPRKDWLRAGIDKATVVLVPHQAMKKALVEHYSLPKAKIKTISHGPNQNPITPADQVTRRITKEVYGKEHSYFYAPSTGHASDNLERLFAAYDIFRARVPEPVRLLVGLPEYGSRHPRAVRKAQKRAKFSEDIVLLPSLSDHEHRNVFSSARAIAYPSLSTRFPLPVLDAWTAEIPVLYTDNDMLMGAGALVQGTDEKSIAEGLVSLVTTPFLASGLVENGKRRIKNFSWEAVAERVAVVLREVASKTDEE